MNPKTTLKRWLQAGGWYVRKTDGLPVGVDLFRDLQRFGIRPKCVFDIGAHCGQTAVGYADSFSGSRVFAFEPESSNFAQLKKATARYPMVVPVNAAVGDQAGKFSMRINFENSQAHSIVPTMDDKTEIVEMTTVDEFCAEQGFFPDFIKVDVEGFELQVIAGARHTLTKSPRAIVVEATLSSTNQLHTQLSELIAALTPSGFRLAALYDQCQWEATGQLEFFNALFVRR